MPNLNRSHHTLIRELHYRNEKFFDLGLIKFDEYINNNSKLLIQMKNAIFSDEQMLILIESVSGDFDLSKFRLGIQLVELNFN